MVQTALEENPFSGQVFVFRGRRGDLIKVLWWDGDGLCLLAKRLERGRFIFPRASSGTVSLTRAQLADAAGRDRLAVTRAHGDARTGGVNCPPSFFHSFIYGYCLFVCFFLVSKNLSGILLAR